MEKQTEEEIANCYMRQLHNLPQEERLNVYSELLDKYNKHGLRELKAHEIVNFMEESQ